MLAECNYGMMGLQIIGGGVGQENVLSLCEDRFQNVETKMVGVD